MSDRLLPTRVAVDRTSMPTAPIYRNIKDSEFPQPVPIGRHKIAFLESEVDEWMASRFRARDANEGVQARRTRSMEAIAVRR